MKLSSVVVGLWAVAAVALAAVPVRVSTVAARQGLVVAGNAQAAAAGLAVLKAHGNAVDAAIATSLALGVTEPYTSGLGGQLVLLYFEAKSGRTLAVDALDRAAAFYPASYLRLPSRAYEYGFSSVCVPGLPAGLWLAHERWGSRPWAELVQPALALARDGVILSAKVRELLAEEEATLRGSRDLTRLYLSDGKLPNVGERLKNTDLAETLTLLANGGREAFYRGAVMERIVADARTRGGLVTAQSFADYQTRIVEPAGIDFLGRRVLSMPAPSIGGAMLLTSLKAFERDRFAGAPLRRGDNLDRIGRFWRALESPVRSATGDRGDSPGLQEKLRTPEALQWLRREALAAPLRAPDLAAPSARAQPETSGAATAFIIVDEPGNVVCAVQSLGGHFGAGVVAKGTGFPLNNSMANFDYRKTDSPGAAASEHRPSTLLAPTLILKDGRLEMALAASGATKGPTAVLQVLLDHLILSRSLRDAIGDTRIHFAAPAESPGGMIEIETGGISVDPGLLQNLGWSIFPSEVAGSGVHFGAIAAVEFSRGRKATGYVDPRHGGAAVGF